MPKVIYFKGILGFNRNSVSTPYSLSQSEWQIKTNITWLSLARHPNQVWYEGPNNQSSHFKSFKPSWDNPGYCNTIAPNIQIIEMHLTERLLNKVIEIHVQLRWAKHFFLVKLKKTRFIFEKDLVRRTAFIFQGGKKAVCTTKWGWGRPLDYVANYLFLKEGQTVLSNSTTANLQRGKKTGFAQVLDTSMNVMESLTSGMSQNRGCLTDKFNHSIFSTTHCQVSNP